MRKLSSIFSLMLLFTGLTFGQAAVDIAVTLNDNAGGTKVLNFGLDLTATNGIDPLLGESDLPPFPPVGVSEIRFDLEPYAGQALSSYKDYRGVPAFPFSGSLQHTLWWQMSTGATTMTVTYNLPTFVDSFRVIDPAGGVFFNSGLLTGSGAYTFTPPSFITKAFFNIYYDNATPVELTSFTGIQSGLTVQLAWTTATEINNKGFDVERKIQNTWEKLSFIEGKGTTTEIQSYSYIDDFSKNLVSGPVAYRLKQIDYDGTSTYSNEILVDVNFSVNEYNLLQNYPNPFNPSTAINYALPFTSNVKIVVYNMLGETMGQLVNQVQESGYHNITFNASNLPSGMYFYSLEAKSVDGASSYSSVKKMMLVK